MAYYYPKKEAALAAGDIYRSHFSVRTELEPSNGWFLVLTPSSVDVFNYPFGPILEFAALDLTAYARLRRRPTSYKGTPLLATSGSPLLRADKKPWEE